MTTRNHYPEFAISSVGEPTSVSTPTKIVNGDNIDATVLGDWLEPILETTAWMGKAACSETANPDVFFPTRDKAKSAIKSAKAICARCEVREECLEYALKNTQNIRCGIFGGLTKKERDQLNKAGRRRSA